MSTSSRVRNHLRSNVVGYLALFLTVTGGTAMAANTVFSSDIVNGEVKSADIGTEEVMTADLQNGGVRSIDILDATVAGVDLANGAVANAKLATDAVNSAKVHSNTLVSEDVRDDTLTGADLAGTGDGNDGFNGDEEIIDGSLSGFDIGNDEIGGNHIIDGSVTAGDTEDVFDAGYGNDGNCDDDDQNGEGCASATVTLNQPGVLLVNATGEWRNFGSGEEPGVQMECVLQVDGSNIGLPQSFGEAGDNHIQPHHGTMALTALSGQLSTGPHAVQTFCTDVNDDIDLVRNQITAARVDL